MIVAFEGLSCAGKSAITTALQDSDNKFYRQIPEFIIDTAFGITTELCIANDVAKSAYAQLIDRENSCVLMDRSFMSTLVYTYAESEDKHGRIKKWYDEALSRGSITNPDLLVYLRIRPDTSLKRASSVDRYKPEYAWYSQPEKACQKYDDYFSQESLQSSSIVYDCDNLPFDALVTTIDLAIKKKMKG